MRPSRRRRREVPGPESRGNAAIRPGRWPPTHQDVPEFATHLAPPRRRTDPTLRPWTPTVRADTRARPVHKIGNLGALWRPRHQGLAGHVIVCGLQGLGVRIVELLQSALNPGGRGGKRGEDHHLRLVQALAVPGSTAIRAIPTVCGRPGLAGALQWSASRTMTCVAWRPPYWSRNWLPGPGDRTAVEPLRSGEP